MLIHSKPLTATDGETVKFRAKVKLRDLKIAEAVGKQREEGLSGKKLCWQLCNGKLDGHLGKTGQCRLGVSIFLCLISQATWSDWKSHTHFSQWPCTQSWPADPSLSSKDTSRLKMEAHYLLNITLDPMSQANPFPSALTSPSRSSSVCFSFTWSYVVLWLEQLTTDINSIK